MPSLEGCEKAAGVAAVGGGIEGLLQRLESIGMVLKRYLETSDVDVTGPLSAEQVGRADGVLGVIELLAVPGNVDRPGPRHKPTAGGVVTPALDPADRVHQSRRQIERFFGLGRRLFAGAGGSG